MRGRLPTKSWALVKTLPSPIALLRIEAGPALKRRRLLLKALRRIAIAWLLPVEWRPLLLLLLLILMLWRVGFREAVEIVLLRRPGKPVWRSQVRKRSKEPHERHTQSYDVE